MAVVLLRIIVYIIEVLYSLCVCDGCVEIVGCVSVAYQNAN